MRDVIGAEIAFSSTGTAAVGFGSENADATQTASAFVSGRSSSRAFSAPHRLPAAQQVLSLAFAGPHLELLLGASANGDSCCGSVQAVSASTQSLAGRHTVVGGLAGATVGRLVVLPGRLLSVVGTERGVWTAQAGGNGRFGPTRRLARAAMLPESVDATSLSGGHSVVVWTARTGLYAAGPRTIYQARGSLAAAPSSSRAAITVATGHRIDELAVGRRGAIPTVAWIESWFDSIGLYHSGAYVADLTGRPAARSVSPAGELASGLSLAADARGAQVIAFRSCDAGGNCALRAALRRAGGGRFGRLARVGAVDASEAPSAAEGPTGKALVGWIDQGHVLAAVAKPGALRFGATRTVSSTGFGADLTTAFAPSGDALAVWTQGTRSESVIGAIYRH
ncbi:MAG: hypothetical protein M3Z06_01150 [Actinomycetota bacterium]|nr:hypothetical protein [Actinomycetota bacterium]